MDVVGKSFDTGGESFRVGDDVSGSVAVELPAIVNDNVLVAGVLHAAANESVGGGLDEILVDVAGEAIPTVPAHRRSASQTVFQGASGRDGNQKREKQKQDAQSPQASTHKFSDSFPVVFSRDPFFKNSGESRSALVGVNTPLRADGEPREERDFYEIAVAAIGAASAV